MEQQSFESQKEDHINKIQKDGYTIVNNVLSLDECKLISEKLDKLTEEDLKYFGKERLAQLNEIGIIRALMAKDGYFTTLILHPKVYPIVSAIMGETAILHLQNSIIVYPEKKHGQSHFHRDFQKDFVSSKPLSLNAIWMIDDFNRETGATWIVPGTHKESEWPSEEYLEKNAIQVNGKAGSVMIFDSMLIHKGGSNKSNIIRRAVNHQFTRPFIKQQIDLPSFLGEKYDKNSKIGQILGYWSIPPNSVEQFRCDPDKRTYRSGQG